MPNWSLPQPAAFDIKVKILQEAAQTCGLAAGMGEAAKHSRMDEALRGWSCIPLVVEVFGGWANEAIDECAV